MSDQKIKCVVWDLDETLWNGILTENKEVAISPLVVRTIKELDRRGILQSIASKNDYGPVMGQLEAFELSQYFIYPQISWNPKSDAVLAIAKSINIGIDTLAFVDDQAYERDEVAFAHPEVLCLDAAEIPWILTMERMNPLFVTEDSKNRREMYQNDIKRAYVEKEFEGSKEEFLQSLQMKFTLTRAVEEDLKRVEELTVRTHQLNSTGDIYSYEELKKLIVSDRHEVLVAQLDDKYGAYGKIGLSLIEKHEDFWELKLLLMSCRVMSRGVGTVLLNHLVNRVKKRGKKLRANFVPTDKNRIMYITYKFGGFKEIFVDSHLTVLEADMDQERGMPDYVTVVEG